MMQQLRNPRVLKYGLWIILLLTIPSFVLFYGFSGDGPSGGGDVRLVTFGTVNTPRGERELDARDEQASRNALTNEYLQLYSAITGQQPSNTIGSQISGGLTRRQIAENAVGLIAFDSLALDSGVVVSDQQVTRRLRDQGFTGEVLRAYLSRVGQREVDFLREQRSLMRAQRAENLITASARVSLLELWLQYKLERDLLDVEYARVPAADFLDEVQIADAEIQTYYESNLDRFIEPERRVYRYVLVEGPARTLRFEVTAEELQAEYDSIDHTVDTRFAEPLGRDARHIRLEVTPDMSEAEILETLDNIKAVVEEGSADFGEMADLTMDLPEGERRGGRVVGRVMESNREFFTLQFGEEWYNRVMALDAGEVSEPFQSNGVWHLAQVVSTGGGKRSLEDARPLLEATIRSRKELAESESRGEIIAENIERVREVVVARTSLDAIAADLQLDIRETSPTATTVTFFPAIGELAPHRETLVEMREGDISPPLRAGNTDSIAVMELARITPQRTQRLDEVRTRVERVLREQKAAELARERAQAIVRRVESGESLTSASVALDANAVVPDSPITRFELPVELRTVRDFANRTFRARVGDVLVLEAGFGESPESYVVLQINGTEEPSQQEFLEEVGEIERSFIASKGRAFLQEFRRDALVAFQPQFSEEYLGADDRAPGRRRR